MTRSRPHWALSLMVGAVGAAAAEPEEPASRGALVRFHTACASCHAQQCSGRRSFESGVPAARGHILRYAPSADAATVRQLFDLLVDLKRRCRTPLPHVASAPARWNAAQLRDWFNPDVDAWFIPLGPQRAGAVKLALEVGKASQSASVEVLDANLEAVAEAPLRVGVVTLALSFEAPTQGFLLVRRVPELRGLSLER